jgi:hypothetical protein
MTNFYSPSGIIYLFIYVSVLLHSYHMSRLTSCCVGGLPSSRTFSNVHNTSIYLYDANLRLMLAAAFE